MNVKLITKALHTLSLLSDEDYRIVLELHELSEDERGMLMLVLEPQKPATKKAGKKSSTSKSSQSSSKSSRASSLRGKIQGTASRTITGPACATCGNVEDHPDHDVGHYLSAHEFDAGKSTAPPASASSPANGGMGSTTRNSEVSAVSAQAATGGSSE